MATRPRLCTCYVNQCLCCSLRAGIITMSILAFVNACLAFAGEAALFSGMLSAVAETAAGQYIPAGVPIDPSNKAAHGGLIFLGLYSLLIAIFGVVAAFKRRVWAATAFLVMMAIDTAMGIAIAVILWFAGGSFTSLLAQLPIFVLNIYMVIVAASYRTQCKAWAAGGDAALPAGGLPPAAPVLSSGGAASSKEDGAGAVYRDGPVLAAGAPPGSALAEVADDDEDDGDLGRGQKAGARV